MDRQDKLIAKIQNEFDQFHWELMGHTKQEIFDKAYQISVKEDIRGFIESEELTERQLNILLSKDNSLDFLYMRWQKEDNSHTEDIENCIWNACNLNANLSENSEDDTENFDDGFDDEYEDDFFEEDEDDFER